MKLFYAPNSCALAVHIALEEAGASYEAVRVHFDRGEQRSPEYLALNPMGRVPALVTDRGVLTEVPALLRYVAACHPEAGLRPDDLFDCASMDSFNAFLSSTVHPEFAHFMRPYRWADDEDCRRAISAKAVGTFAEYFSMIERERLAGPWVLGSQYTLSDPYLYVLTRWLRMAAIDVARFPKVADHFRRMGQREAVGRALGMEGLT